MAWEPTHSGKYRKQKPTNRLVRPDGAALDAPPTLLVPESVPQESRLDIAANPSGVMIVIENGDTLPGENGLLTATTVPWSAVPNIVQHLIRLLAMYSPRPTEEEGK